MVPYWVEDAIFYQIFPDRFANGDTRNDPVNVQPWGSTPTLTGFQGGDLAGIIQKFDYLLDLGVNAVYINPIFQSPSNHRYNTTDYYRIDPKLGSSGEFKDLLELAHRNGVRIILDGVFNHAGRGFWAFNDILENQAQSPYKDWFHIQRFPVDAYSPGPAKDYLGWWDLKSLPKFNTDHPAARRYLLDVARYWTAQGIDGWRLDVPNEIDDDAFWAEFREIVRSVNPEAYLVGEIWEADPRWANDTHFDGLLNYPLRTALLGFLDQKLTATEFGRQAEALLGIYPRENAYAMFSMLGSHDTERILTHCGGDINKVRLAMMFQFSYPGVPVVYYGDEIGLEGEEDPDCRQAFPWDESRWKPGLRPFVQRLVAIRKRLATLRRGNMVRLLADDKRGVFVFARTLGVEQVVIALNASSTHRTIRIPVEGLNMPDGQIVHNLVGAGEYFISGTTLTVSLEPWSGAWLQ